MALFNKWDGQTRTDGEPIEIKFDQVASVEEMVKTDYTGVTRHCARVRFKSGRTEIVAVPAGEVQDRLNDDIASAPEMPAAVTEAAQAPANDPDEPTDWDEDDD